MHPIRSEHSEVALRVGNGRFNNKRGMETFVGGTEFSVAGRYLVVHVGQESAEGVCKGAKASGERVVARSPWKEGYRAFGVIVMEKWVVEWQ